MVCHPRLVHVAKLYHFDTDDRLIRKANPHTFTRGDMNHSQPEVHGRH